MNPVIEHAAIFERAVGPRMIAAERFVIGWSDLFGKALRNGDVAIESRSRLFIAIARFDAATHGPELDARFEFWADRADGKCIPLGDLGKRELANFLARVEQCDYRLKAVPPEQLAGRLDGLLADMGITRDPSKLHQPRAELHLDLGGTEPITYLARERHLFVSTPIVPPIGDRLTLRLTVPGREIPYEVEARVATARLPGKTRPAGEPADFGLELSNPPSELISSLGQLSSQRTPARPSPPPVPPPTLHPPAPTRPPPATTSAPPRLAYAARPPVERVRIEFTSTAELAPHLSALSAGGVFARTERPLPLMTDVSVEVVLPAGGRVDALGTVVSTEPLGMGIELRLDSTERARLASILRRYAADRKAVTTAVKERLVQRMLADTPPVPESDEGGVRFGNYQLLSLLGRGGMAEVFYARALAGPREGQTVALKRLLPELAASPECVEMFTSEADLSRLLDHPSIVKVFEVGMVEETYYMVMEVVDGRDLGQILRRCKQQGIPLPIDFAVYLAQALLGALDYAHNAKGLNGRPLNLVHRDISPSNLFVSRLGEVKLGDFGVARARGLMEPATVAGKSGYLSPEALAGEATIQADLWAAAVTLYEMLTLERPFTGRNVLETFMTIQARRYRPIRELRPDVSPELEQILRRAFAKKPADRFASAAEFSAALAPHFDAQVGTPLAIAAMVRGLFGVHG